MHAAIKLNIRFGFKKSVCGSCTGKVIKLSICKEYKKVARKSTSTSRRIPLPSQEYSPSTIPRTSRQMDYQAWMDPSAMEFLERIPVLISTSPAEDLILTTLNIELEMKVDVIANKYEAKLGRIIAPLIDMSLDYKGSQEQKKLWTSLSVITAFGLDSGCKVGSETVYKAELSKGVKLHIQSKKLCSICAVLHHFIIKQVVLFL